jgi:hypothetical protein
MSRGSVFARAIGLTKSLSGLTFERDEPVESVAGGDDHENVTTAEAAAPGADDAAAAKIDAIAAETPDSEAAALVGGTASNENDAAEGAPPLAEEIALSTVTIVPSEAAADQEATITDPADSVASTEDETVAIDTVTIADENAAPAAMASIDESSSVVAIDPIAADIASLLASLDSTQHDGVPQAPTPAAEVHAEDEEDATIVLLGELNRLWLARRSRSPAYLR